MRKVCSFGGCNRIVDVAPNQTKTPRCDKHPLSYSPKKVYEHHHHQGKHIYSSARWRNLRNQFIKHNPLCAHCKVDDIITPGDMVDHIVEIEDGGEIWDVDNLQTLCNSCHNKKTGNEVKKRRRRKNNNGFGSLSDY